MYLSNGGSVKKAQQMANHFDPRTTKLYDRRLDEVERFWFEPEGGRHCKDISRP